MPKPASAPDAARQFAALGDPRRLAILSELADRPKSITELGAAQDISRQGLSKHLRTLEQAGLVRSTRFGREVRFRLEQEALADAQAFLATVSSQWSDALNRLVGHIETD
jgi:DNA-binding transcriptional ArsR family regulator